MSPDRDKWNELFDDEERTGEYVDPGPPEAAPGDEGFHDDEPPRAEESGELTDEFAAIESQFLGDLGGPAADEVTDSEESPAGPVAASASGAGPEDGPATEAPATPPADEAVAEVPTPDEPPADVPPAEEPPAPQPPDEAPPQVPPVEVPPPAEPPTEVPPPAEPPTDVPPPAEPPTDVPPAAEGPELVDPQPTEEAVPVVGAVPPPPPAVSQPTQAQRSLAATVEQISKEQIDGRKPAPLWTRFLAGSLVIVISMATATAVSLIVYLSDIAKGLADQSGELKGVQQRLASVDGGDPQTIMILGSDIRPEIEEEGRSDTTMLLRLDGDRNMISLFSLPRDLKVNIPGVGIDKLNAAYAYGGPKKTLEVVQQITGLDINHVVNVDFRGFGKAVDAIDCVYVDVDREYYHSNVGLAPSEHFAEIDIGAGYQRLCGLRALQYVRYRHTDNDIVRSARQQDFLREARQKVGPAKLWQDREQMIDIFTRYTSSDIDDLPTMIEVLKLFISARDAPVNQIHFEGGFEETYVTASNSQMKGAVAEFLGESEGSGAAKFARARKGSGGGKPAKKPAKKPRKASGLGQTPMVEPGAETIAFVELMARRKRMPAFMPTRIEPGSYFDDETRGYQIRMPNDKFADAYKLVFQRPGQFGVPEYYGVMATEWKDPPILENPSETREINGREYLLFYDAGRLRMVGFKTNRGAYWVSNTLLQGLDEPEMLAIAAGMREVKG